MCKYLGYEVKCGKLLPEIKKLQGQKYICITHVYLSFTFNIYPVASCNKRLPEKVRKKVLRVFVLVD